MGFLALATIALPVVVGIFFKPWFTAALGASILTGVFAVLLWFARRRNQARSLLFLPAVFMLVFTLYSVQVLIPKLEYYKSPRPFCEEIVARLAKGGSWAMFQFYRAAYVYYTDSFCKVLQTTEELQTFLKLPTQALVVMKERRYRQVKDHLMVETYVLATKQIGHRKMVLVSNQNE
jgi:Na+/melibiose symporter-like transporter